MIVLVLHLRVELRLTVDEHELLRLGCLTEGLIACTSFGNEIRLGLGGMRRILVIKLVEVVGNCVFLLLLGLLGLEADWSLRCLQIGRKLVKNVE